MNREQYTKYNAEQWDQWVEDGIEWGIPISHEDYLAAKNGTWDVYLTPMRPVPHSWFPALKGAQLLGLASGVRTADAGFCRFGRKLYGV